jgi:hypothetical protein
MAARVASGKAFSSLLKRFGGGCIFKSFCPSESFLQVCFRSSLTYFLLLFEFNTDAFYYEKISIFGAS